MKNQLTLTLFLLFAMCHFSFGQDVREYQRLCDAYISKGEPQAENAMVDGMKQGYWVHWCTDEGAITTNPDSMWGFLIINYEKNAPVGPCIGATKKGVLKFSMNFKQDTTFTLHGTSYYFSNKGEIEQEANFDNGMAHGQSIIYHSNGTPQTTWFHSHDTLISVTQMFKDGWLHEQEFFTYSGSDTLSEKESLREDGSVIIREHTKNGVIHGKYEIFFSDGTPKISAMYENEFMVKSTLYYSNGDRKQEIECDSTTNMCHEINYDKEGYRKSEYEFGYREGIILVK